MSKLIDRVLDTHIDESVITLNGLEIVNLHHLGSLSPKTPMNILGLSPNNGRLAVRLWISEPLEDLLSNIAQHKIDLEIGPTIVSESIPLYRLLLELAPYGKADSFSARFGGESAESVLTGGRYPRTLFVGLLNRIRADKSVNAVRAAFCKAIVNRDIELTERPEHEKIPVGFNATISDTAYNLGRLFAVYEYSEQAVATRAINTRRKFIGAAAANPRRFFPLLRRNNEQNQSVLARGFERQRVGALGNSILVCQIVRLLSIDDPYPNRLSLEGQARFFVGYYHQNCALYNAN